MESAVAIVSMVQGLVIGLVSWDMIQRLSDRRALKEAERKQGEAAEELSKLHNSSAQKVQDISDKVSSLEASIKMGPVQMGMRKP